MEEEEVVFWLEVDLVELILRPREGRRKNPEVLASSNLNMGSHRRTVEEGEGRKEGRGRFGVEGGRVRAGEERRWWKEGKRIGARQQAFIRGWRGTVMR